MGMYFVGFTDPALTADLAIAFLLADLLLEGKGGGLNSLKKIAESDSHPS